MQKQNFDVPSYHLYGESDGLTDILHCEAITTRSAMHGWSIKPHRHSRLHQFFLVRTGGGTFRIDEDTGPIQVPRVLNVPPSAIHAFDFTAGTEGWVVTIPTELLDFPTARELEAVLSNSLNVATNSTINQLFAQIAEEYTRHDAARNHNLHALAMLLAGHIARTASQTESVSIANGEPPLIKQFRELIEGQFRNQWTAARYARELAVTTTHLSRLTKKHTGMPASKLIEARRIQEARRDLAYTSLRVSDVAYRLGYADPAYFTRVFTRATKLTPSVFRSSLQDHVE